MSLKVVSINSLSSTRDNILKAAYKTLACKGFINFSPDDVADEAGVTRKALFRQFHGMRNLIKELGDSGIYWPLTSELISLAPKKFPEIAPEDQIGAFFSSMRKALFIRPETLRILGWEIMERSALSEELENIRERTALEFFEHLKPDVPDDIDLGAAVALIGSGFNYLAIRSLNTRTFGGIELQTDEGWERIERTMKVMLRGLLFP
jgi:AcrR family transcriptional regulator